MVPDARVVVSTALSGGTLRQRLRDACRRFGARRLALDLACVRMDFSLPAPYGTGTALTPQQLTELRGRRTVFFSPELCARYFTYEQSGMTHFVLFDDADTLHRKIALGTESGHPCRLSGPAGSDGGAFRGCWAKDKSPRESPSGSFRINNNAYCGSCARPRTSCGA